MGRLRQFDEFARAVDLLATPLAVRVLYGLGHGGSVHDAVPEGTDIAQVEAAVQRLVEFGVVQYGADGLAPPESVHAVLTPKGRRVLHALESSEQQDR